MLGGPLLGVALALHVGSGPLHTSRKLPCVRSERAACAKNIHTNDDYCSAVARTASRGSIMMMADDNEEAALSEEEMDALRLPQSARQRAQGASGEWSLEESNRMDVGDPLGGGAADEMFAQAEFRVRRRAAAGEYNATATSRSLPLIALVAQVGFGGAICAFVGYCWLINEEAAKGAAWAVDALAGSEEWVFGLFGRLWGKPPGGPAALFYAGANGLNVVRCLPLLFDRLIVSRLPESEFSAEEQGGVEDDDR